MQKSSPSYTLDAVPPGFDPSVGTAIREALGDDAFNALGGGFEIINGVEYAMDVIAIRDEFAWEEVPALVFPTMDYVRVREQMPYSVHNHVRGSGGERPRRSRQTLYCWCTPTAR
jgi:hypothetical protein